MEWWASVGWHDEARKHLAAIRAHGRDTYGEFLASRADGARGV